MTAAQEALHRLEHIPRAPVPVAHRTWSAMSWSGLVASISHILITSPMGARVQVHSMIVWCAAALGAIIPSLHARLPATPTTPAPLAVLSVSAWPSDNG